MCTNRRPEEKDNNNDTLENQSNSNHNFVKLLRFYNSNSCQKLQEPTQSTIDIKITEKVSLSILGWSNISQSLQQIWHPQVLLHKW